MIKLLMVLAAVSCAFATTVPAQGGGLPMGQGWLTPEERKELPAPFGISYDNFGTKETMLLRDASIAINGVPIPSQILNIESLVTDSTENDVRADVWLLPFLNLYFIDGTFSGTAKNINASVAGMPLPIPPEVSYSGSTRGLGVTAAGGYKRLFLSYDYNTSWESVDRVTGKVKTVTQGPRLGVRLGGKRGLRSHVYVGGFKMSIDTNQEGSIVLPGVGEVAYKLQAIPETRWNYLVGAEVRFNKSIEMVFEKGFGKRTQTMFSLGCRF